MCNAGDIRCAYEQSTLIQFEFVSQHWPEVNEEDNKYIGHKSQFLGRDLNPIRPDYEAGILAIES
jgi:hypothetical protein